MRRRLFTVLIVAAGAWRVAAGCGDDAARTSTPGDAEAAPSAPDAEASAPPSDAAPDAGADIAVDSSSPFDAGRSVYQHHNHATRDGLFVDPALTKSAAAGLHADPSFDAPIAGPVYAQPLYIEQGPSGKAILIVATEQNVVYALDAKGGTVVWKTPALATPAPAAKLSCFNVDPVGITGTPYADIPSRTIFVATMTLPDDGGAARHAIFALSLDDGSVRKGWPVDVPSALAKIAGAPPFSTTEQNQRGALLVQDGVLYVPYGGNSGDCGLYRGWVVGVDVADPTRVAAYWTAAPAGGIWGVSGVSSDGMNVFATTGNTNTNADPTWKGGNAVLRLGRGPTFSSDAKDYYAPANWLQLDAMDLDLAGSAAIVLDVPGATPSKLLAAGGKDGNVYLIDRSNLGGVGGEVAKKPVAQANIIGAATTFTAPSGTYLSVRLNGGGPLGCPPSRQGSLVTLRITPTQPPDVVVAWCGAPSSVASPISTTTGNGSDAIVWVVAVDRLLAYDGETGAEVFTGGGPAELLPDVHYFQAPIVANGRIFVAGHSRLYAFKP